MVEKRVKIFGQGPPPFSGNARKKSIFFMGGVPLPQHPCVEVWSALGSSLFAWQLQIGARQSCLPINQDGEKNQATVAKTAAKWKSKPSDQFRAKYDKSSNCQSRIYSTHMNKASTNVTSFSKQMSPWKDPLFRKKVMESRGGFEDDGSMEDAMAEQEELESRVNCDFVFVNFVRLDC